MSESVTEQGKLKQKPYAVFGIGSNSYPRFCAAADLVDSMLVGAGGQRLAPVQKGAFCSVLCCAVLCCAVLCCAVLCCAARFKLPAVCSTLYATCLASCAVCCYVTVTSAHSGDSLGGRERTFQVLDVAGCTRHAGPGKQQCGRRLLLVYCTYRSGPPSLIAAPDPAIAVRGLCLGALSPPPPPPPSSPKKSGFSVPSPQLYRSGSGVLLGLATSGCERNCLSVHDQSHITYVGLHSSNVSKTPFHWTAHNKCCDACMYMEGSTVCPPVAQQPLSFNLAGTVPQALLQLTWHIASS